MSIALHMILLASLAHILLLPYIVSENTESRCVFVHILRHIGNDFLGTWMGKIGSRFLNHLTVDLRIINNHARSKMVGIVRLSIPNTPKQIAI